MGTFSTVAPTNVVGWSAEVYGKKEIIQYTG